MLLTALGGSCPLSLSLSLSLIPINNHIFWPKYILGIDCKWLLYLLWSLSSCLWRGIAKCRLTQGYQKFYNGATFSIQAVNIEKPPPNCKTGQTCQDWSHLAATTAVLFRRNTVDSNGGFNIANGANTTFIRDIIIEGNTVLKSDSDKAMQVSPAMLNQSVMERNNVVP